MLLAAMETCWVYAILSFFAYVVSFPRFISPFAIFIAYWIAIVVGRVLPRRKERWIVLQASAILIAFITMLAIARIELYDDAWFDFAWLPNYVVNLFSILSRLTPAHLSAAAVLFAFIRGLGFGQRPMTLWFTGYQFRLGIVIFFVLLIVASIFKQFDPSLALFIYFFISLIAIALARIDELDSAQRLSSRWSGTLVVSVIVVLCLGFLLLQFLNVDSASLLLWVFTPIGLFLSALLFLMAIPAGILAGWFVELMRPLFGQLGQMMNQMSQFMPLGAQDALENFQTAANSPQLISILKTIAIAALILVVGYWLARALQRRMKIVEDEEYIRESVSRDERFGERGRRMKKKTAPRKKSTHLAAESIRRIYAALVARAAENGLPRQVAETPYEFLPRLENKFADNAADLRAITDAYVDVHYAEHTATEERVKSVKEAWERIKRNA